MQNVSNLIYEQCRFYVYNNNGKQPTVIVCSHNFYIHLINEQRRIIECANSIPKNFEWNTFVIANHKLTIYRTIDLPAGKEFIIL